MKFNTSYSPGPSKAEPKCPREVPDRILNKSTGKLEVVGTIPIYERIQSHHESSTISFKLKRFAMGDSVALGSPRDCDVDLCGVPSTLQDVLAVRKTIQDQFGELPADVRECFANNFESFYQAVIDGTAERKLSEYSRGKSAAGAATADPTAVGAGASSN